MYPLVFALLAFPLAFPLAAPLAAEPASPDPAPPNQLADEISRLDSMVRDTTRTDELWLDARAGAAPMLTRAQDALARGRRLLALHRLAVARSSLQAAAYVGQLPRETREQLPAFEAEWRRVGSRLHFAPMSAAHQFEDVHPAAVRALVEAAAARVSVQYESSLEYGRATLPDYGLYYLGSAVAEEEFVDFCRAVSPTFQSAARLAATSPAPTAAANSPPLVRSLAAELDALEGELLALYQPPASIDRHPEFISAGGLLKEARELDDAGLHHGALLRYLQAAQRVAVFQSELSSLPRSEVAGRLEAARTSIDHRSKGSGDSSLLELFVEIAEAAIEDTSAASQQLASTLAADVLPRYLRAVGPAAAELRPTVPIASPIASPIALPVTVTLVRWPYT